FVALMLDGSRVNTYRGRTFTQATASAHATGLADLVVRTKYTLFQENATGLAAAVDVRLPTGRSEDLLGSGSAALKISGIGSIDSGRTAAHVNGGVSVGGLTKEITYGTAVTYAATGRLSLVGELLGRWLDSPGHILAVSAPHPRLIGVETVRLTPGASSLHIMTAVPGFKWNLTDTWVLAGNVSVPLTQGGLTAPFTPFIGLDYSLGR